MIPHFGRFVCLGTFMVAAVACSAFAQQSIASPKPPVGVPKDAKYFNGKWYAVVLERLTWRRAKERCAQAGGQLAIVPDEATQTVIRELANGLKLWPGATDEKVEGRWLWVDGTPMKFTAWTGQQPDNGGRREHYLQAFAADAGWNDDRDNGPGVVGFICEWKGK